MARTSPPPHPHTPTNRFHTLQHSNTHARTHALTHACIHAERERERERERDKDRQTGRQTVTDRKFETTFSQQEKQSSRHTCNSSSRARCLCFTKLSSAVTHFVASSLFVVFSTKREAYKNDWELVDTYPLLEKVIISETKQQKQHQNSMLSARTKTLVCVCVCMCVCIIYSEVVEASEIMPIHSSFDFEKARVVVCVAVNEINYDNLVHAYSVHHEPVTWNPNPRLNFVLRK